MTVIKIDMVQPMQVLTNKLVSNIHSQEENQDSLLRLECQTLSKL